MITAAAGEMVQGLAVMLVATLLVTPCWTFAATAICKMPADGA
jgi:hypothetical protein